ncbi:MAG: flippase [Patescibacteria group bacterium]|nr:flippase [Patescibacteria group bacterium]
MSLSKKIVFNTFAQFFNRFAIAGSAFLVSLLLARYFGARGFGEYAKATTFIAFFYLFADFGMNAYVLREITHNPDREKEIVGNLFGLRLIVGVILTLLSFLVTFILPYDSLRNEGFTPVSKQAIMVLSILVLYQAFLNTTNVIFQKHLKYAQSTLASIVGSLVTLVAVVIFLYFRSSLPIVLFGYSIGCLFSSIILLNFVKKLFIHFTPLFNWREYKNIIFRSLPLGLTLVFNLVYFRADVFILTLFRTTTEVGTYGLAYKFFEFPLALPTFFANSLYPILLNRVKDKELFKETIIKAGLFLLGLSVIVLLGFYIGAPLLVFIRKDFYPSIEVLRILSLSMPVFFLSSLSMWIMITFGKNKQLLIIYFLGMIINIILNLIFIPFYGAGAAAIITLISESLILIASGMVALKLVW